MRRGSSWGVLAVRRESNLPHVCTSGPTGACMSGNPVAVAQQNLIRRMAG